MILLFVFACAAEPGAPPASAVEPTDSAAPDTGEVLRGALQLAFPLQDRAAFDVIVGFDHDPVVQADTAVGRLTCADYLGRAFPHCYDEHHGTDFILRGGFSAMDAGSATIHAAAPGEVVDTEDGHYDRCRASAATGSVDCDGHERVANSVTLEHEGGVRTRYLHMMTDSVAVTVGQQVEAGHVLGKVGSSGFSSMPHLHLTVVDAVGASVDPYAGPFSQPETWWCEQDGGDGLPGGCGG